METITYIILQIMDKKLITIKTNDDFGLFIRVKILKYKPNNKIKVKFQNIINMTGLEGGDTIRDQNTQILNESELINRLRLINKNVDLKVIE